MGFLSDILCFRSLRLLGTKAEDFPSGPVALALIRSSFQSQLWESCKATLLTEANGGIGP